MKNTVIEQAINLANTGKEDNFEAAQALLMEYLKTHPQNTQAWLLLATIESNPPLEDAERIAHYAQHILSYDPLNIYALLLCVYADCYGFGRSNVELYQKLCKLPIKNKKLMAMLEVAKAFYLEYTNQKEYENVLKKSIEYHPLISNLRMLGNLYMEQGKTAEAQFFLNELEKRRKNLEAQWKKKSKTSMYSSLNYLLNEFLAGE